MSLLVATGLAKAFGALDVFEGVDLRVEAGDRIGFVGANGAGKTTVLRILAGVDSPTAGDVARKRGLTVGYLPQDPPPASDLTLHAAMLQVFAQLQDQAAALREMEHRLAGAAHDGSDGYDGLLEAYGHAQAAFEVAGGYDYETRIRQVLGGLGFNEDQHEKPLAHLSGGERTRALLAQLILQETDVLLLDEPTNHLDLEAVEWLEETLLHWRGGLVVVAHDRYFLDKVANRIWDMNFGRLETYRGNYSSFRVQKEMRLDRQRTEWESQQEFIEKTEEFIRRNLAGQRTKEAQGRRTRLERFLRDEALDRPQDQQQIRLGLTTQIRSGDLVLATKNLAVGYDRPLFYAEDTEIRRGDRVALIGPNGAGKTTLLKTILGDLSPLHGKVRFGASVEVAYLAQAQAGLDPDETVLDAILDVRNLPLAQARNFLGQFLFRGDDVFRTIGTLSGGQRSRVALARMTLQGANLLLLDEPTNHLDLDTQEILEQVLGQFPGTILLVTHDRWLVQALATQVWRVDGDEMRVYKGNYAEYQALRAAETDASVKDKAPDADAGVDNDRERAREERRQRKAAEKRMEVANAIEARIHQIERKLGDISADLERASMAGDVGKVQRLGVAYQQLEDELHREMTEWAALT